MRKKTIFFLSAILALSLTGCSNIKDRIGDQMMKQSGVLADANYQKYKQYAEAGALDVDGYYIERVNEDKTAHAQIRVTFAVNNNLSVQYYTDAVHRNAVDMTDCYLNPGASIYAVVAVNDDVFSSMYDFSGFRIYEIDADGKRTESAELQMTESEEEYVLNIPASFTGTDISIEPVGAYQQRTISLNDYYTDDNNAQMSLTGTWVINDKEYTSDSVEISPVTPYIISYEYDSNEYFYLSSSPECYYTNNEEGIVIFNQREAGDETADYSVELHKYISVTLISDMDRQVKVNGEDAYQSVKANGELVLDHLKYGDTVTIQTNKEWLTLETNKELILTNTEPLYAETYKYTLIVPEKDGEFMFVPSDYSYEHGTITFKCFGQTVTTPQMLAKGSKIYYEQASANTGYWLAGDNNYIVVGEEAETIAALKAIHFTPMVNVTVSLPQPTGGTVTYKLNGTRVYNLTVSTYSGATITMSFDPWEGWISSVTGEATYRVGDDTTQTVNADGKAIDTVLTEDDGHKPNLSLNLEKTVGESMEFKLEASGYTTLKRSRTVQGLTL